MSEVKTQVTPQEWARGQPALQSPGGTPASSHSHGGTPGPNGGFPGPTKTPYPMCVPRMWGRVGSLPQRHRQQLT